MLSIAIDGPSGSGKSTVAKELARRNGLAYLDTGATYRAATWWALHEGADLDDAETVVALTEAMPLDQSLDPDHQVILVADTDITTDIRSKEIAAVVSKVAVNLAVRALLKAKQREIIASQDDESSYSHGKGIVAEGRDITTVVYPEADLRILLTASEEARLMRRAKEMGEAEAEKIRDLVSRRDRDDSTVSSFMEASDGVIHIDSSAMTIDEVVATIEDLMRRPRE